MKKLKAILSAFLILALFCSLFAACSSSEETNTTGGGSDNPAADESGTGDGGIDYGEEDGEEIPTVKMVFPDVRMTGADFGPAVNDAINEYLEPTYGLHVDIQWMTYADLQTKLQLNIAGGDWIDLIPTSMWNAVNIIYPKGMLMDITDLMNEYAPETLTLMSEYLGPYMYDGRLYGVPTLRSYVKNLYIIMRKDILEELDLVELAENMSTWSEFEQILAAVSEQYDGTGLYGIGRGAGASVISGTGYMSVGDRFEDYRVWDNLADPAQIVMTDESGNVSFYQAEADFEAECARAAQWMQNGWVYPDTPISEDHGDSLMKQNVQFSSIQPSEFGVEITKGTNCGYDLLCRQLTTGMVKTDTLVFQGVGVTTNSEEPEAACRLINLMYTDAKLMNMLVWGVEGTDYTLQDDQVVFPEGGHFYQADYFMGNNLLLTPLMGNGADFYEHVKEINEAATNSQFLGFALDTTALDLLTANLTAVKDQYYNALTGGNYTPEMYQEYLNKMYDAGAQEYLDEVQVQLDAWMAAR